MTLTFFCLFVIVVCVCLIVGHRLRRYYRRRCRSGSRWNIHRDDATTCCRAELPHRNRRKLVWVTQELIRLKALSPMLGCRVIAEVFNRQFTTRRVSVSRSYVAQALRRHHSEIAYLRQTLKHRVPRDVPVNRTWAMDLTGKAELDGTQRLILGLIDHGSRALLALDNLPDKRSLTILRALVAAFRRYGLPRRIRVDNEACFASRAMSLAMDMLGIRLQRIQPHCPWQNGRIERVFGTLKSYLDRVNVLGTDDLRRKLLEFRSWYNTLVLISTWADGRRRRRGADRRRSSEKRGATARGTGSSLAGTSPDSARGDR
jgi:putative transposase